jgi:hypothetical protein
VGIIASIVTGIVVVMAAVIDAVTGALICAPLAMILGRVTAVVDVTALAASTGSGAIAATVCVRTATFSSMLVAATSGAGASADVETPTMLSSAGAKASCTRTISGAAGAQPLAEKSMPNKSVKRPQRMVEFERSFAIVSGFGASGMDDWWSEFPHYTEKRRFQ